MQKRQTQTKAIIKDSLASLLLEEKFEDISISKLTRKAGINRGTFYLHYIDKYDMMDQLKAETLAQLTQILEDTDLNPKATIKAALDYLKNDFTFICAISKSSFTDFSQTITIFLKNMIKNSPMVVSDLANSYHIPEKYALEMLVASIESIITLWIADGATESTEEMTEIIFNVSYFDKWC